jgi:putative hydrolase of the HAD superfamily
MPSPFARFRVLTFDVVGTLIDFETGMLDHLRASGAVPAGVTDDSILDAYRRSRGAPDVRLFPDDLERVYGDLVRDVDLPDDPRRAQAFRDSAERWPAYPDSVAALKRLARRYRLVAVTNAQRWALDHFVRTLECPFWDTISVDDSGAEKPDPQVFAFARGRISRSGFSKAETLHVAQSQYHDIGIAKQLGYVTCWIERRQGRPGSGGTITAAKMTVPDHHFATLAALADAVEAADGP